MLKRDTVNLTLFFTQEMSLCIWEQEGWFDREVVPYIKLQQYGIRVSFITYGGVSDLKYSHRLPGITIHCNQWKLPLFLYKFLLPLLHASCLSQTNIIKTNQTYGADVALWAARFWRKPLIVRCGYMWSEFVSHWHGTNSSEANIARNLEQKVFSNANKVVVTTSMMATDIANRITYSKDNIFVIPNYIDTNKFCPVANTNKKFDIVFVGRIAPQKNIETLLMAVDNLNLQVLLIGDGKLREELQQRFSKSKSTLHWLGRVPNDDLPLYLNQARLFILPSHYEGHPKALIEAMSCGLAVIGTNVTGITELISHQHTGFLCGKSHQDIQSAIQEILSNSQLCEYLGGNARNYVVENFALDKIVDKELALFSELI